MPAPSQIVQNNRQLSNNRTASTAISFQRDITGSIGPSNIVSFQRDIIQSIVPSNVVSFQRDVISIITPSFAASFERGVPILLATNNISMSQSIGLFKIINIIEGNTVLFNVNEQTQRIANINESSTVLINTNNSVRRNFDFSVSNNVLLTQNAVARVTKIVDASNIAKFGTSAGKSVIFSKSIGNTILLSDISNSNKVMFVVSSNVIDLSQNIIKFMGFTLNADNNISLGQNSSQFIGGKHFTVSNLINLLTGHSVIANRDIFLNANNNILLDNSSNENTIFNISSANSLIMGQSDTVSIPTILVSSGNSIILDDNAVKKIVFTRSSDNLLVFDSNGKKSFKLIASNNIDIKSNAYYAIRKFVKVEENVISIKNISGQIIAVNLIDDSQLIMPPDDVVLIDVDKVDFDHISRLRDNFMIIIG